MRAACDVQKVLARGASLWLRLVRDAAMVVANRGGPRLGSQSKFVKEGAVPGSCA